jgi:hypothetical protein
MQDLYIAASNSSPEIRCDYQRQEVTIRGESYPENTAAFYAPLRAWLAEYFHSAQGTQLALIIELVYFNSSSSKVLLDLLDWLDDLAAEGRVLSVNWIYDAENEMALDAGTEFGEDLNALTFHLRTKPAGTGS